MSESYFFSRKTCPVCKSAHTETLYSATFNEPPISTYLEDFYRRQGGVEFDYLKGEKFTLDECLECGLVYQRSIPNDFLMKKLYNEWIDPKKVNKLKVKRRKVEYYSKLAKEVEACIRYFDDPIDELVFFDFGMGWGDWCQIAKAYGCSVFGTELSEEKIKYAKDAGLSIINWEEIPEYQFHFINTEQVFEHIAKPLETLEYLSESLMPGGIIKINVPNGGNIKERLSIMDWKAPKGTKHSLNPVAPLEHINCFSYHSLMNLGQIVGLSSVQIQERVKLNKKLLNFTLRDILKHYYRMFFRSKTNTTYLFFQKS